MTLPITSYSHNPYSISLETKFNLLFNKVNETAKNLFRKFLHNPQKSLPIFFSALVGTSLSLGITVGSIVRTTMMGLALTIPTKVMLIALAAILTIAVTFSVFFIAGFCLSSIPQIGQDRPYLDHLLNLPTKDKVIIGTIATLFAPITLIASGFILGNYCWHKLK